MKSGSIHKMHVQGNLICISEVITGNEERVLASRQSVATGKVNEMFISTRFGKLVNWGHDWPDHLIQEYFPELSAEEREFLISGMTPEEWDDF